MRLKHVILCFLFQIRKCGLKRLKNSALVMSNYKLAAVWPGSLTTGQIGWAVPIGWVDVL